MAEDREGIEFMAGLFDGINNGYLIDIGAHDGVAKGSMTRELVLKGWGGLMVEPLPKAFALLHNAYRTNPGIYCINAACSDVEGDAILYPCDGVSTLDSQWAEVCEGWWKHVKYGAPIPVKTHLLSNLMDQANSPSRINLLQIDTEGHDLRVLKGMDWQRRTVDVVCVETLDMIHPERKVNGIHQPNPEMNDYLVTLGFQLKILTKGGNGIYVRGGL